MAPSPFTFITFTVILAIVYVHRRREWLQRLHGCRLPPGPRGWPIIGSLLDMPSGDRPWTIYREWAKKYGMELLLLSSALAWDLDGPETALDQLFY